MLESGPVVIFPRASLPDLWRLRIPLTVVDASQKRAGNLVETDVVCPVSPFASCPNPSRFRLTGTRDAPLVLLFLPRFKTSAGALPTAGRAVGVPLPRAPYPCGRVPRQAHGDRAQEAPVHAARWTAGGCYAD